MSGGDDFAVGQPRNRIRFIRVMSDPKFRMTEYNRRRLLDDYLSLCETVNVHDPPEVPERRDPAGRPSLELALFAQADAQATGDRDLLSLEPVIPILIITPATLRERAGYSEGTL